jgi:hypothetical protein
LSAAFKIIRAAAFAVFAELNFCPRFKNASFEIWFFVSFFLLIEKRDAVRCVRFMGPVSIVYNAMGGVVHQGRPSKRIGCLLQGNAVLQLFFGK